MFNRRTFFGALAALGLGASSKACNQLTGPRRFAVRMFVWMHGEPVDFSEAKPIVALKAKGCSASKARSVMLASGNFRMHGNAGWLVFKNPLKMICGDNWERRFDVYVRIEDL